MKVIIPKSQSPVTRTTSPKEEITYDPSDVSALKKRRTFLQNMQKLFGYKVSPSKKFGGDFPLSFIKLDPEHQFAVAQGKLGKEITGKLSASLEEFFKTWLNDTSTVTQTLQNRFLRISELEFAVNNDPFIGRTANLQADEACQPDQKSNIITIECENILMKKRMEELLVRWGVTASRIRTTLWQLGVYGDAFWGNKVTEEGVVRIRPLDIRSIIDRLEFNPVRTISDLNIKNGIVYSNQISKSAYLSLLLDSLMSDEPDEFCDYFDSKLFGFIVSKDQVVPGWSVTHFRVSPELSEYFPFGKSPIIQALAPFKQVNATMSLQALARIANMPITYFAVKAPEGMDFERKWAFVNQVRAQVENYGDTGNPTETYSVNTKLWGIEGTLSVQAISPNIDINAIGDLAFYQDRVPIALGVPKGYFATEMSQWGVSGISLMEQHKPFSRSIFSLQESFLTGLANLFRLHFAITGEFNYFEPFALSMHFPNSESSNDRIQIKQSSLALAKDVIDTISNIIASLNDPIPPEIIEDILTKYSFLDRKDVEKWLNIKNLKLLGNIKKTDTLPDESGEEGGFEAGDIGGGSFGGGGASFTGGGEEGIETEPETETEAEEPTEGEIPSEPEIEKPEAENESFSYYKFALKHLTEKRRNELIERYRNTESLIEKAVSKKFMEKIKSLSEGVLNDRHFVYCADVEDMRPILETSALIFSKEKRGRAQKLIESLQSPEKQKKLQEGLQALGLPTLDASQEEALSTEGITKILEEMKNKHKLSEINENFSLENIIE